MSRDREYLEERLPKIQRMLELLEAQLGRVPEFSINPADDPTGRAAWLLAKHNAEQGLKTDDPDLRQTRMYVCMGWIEIALSQGWGYEAVGRQKDLEDRAVPYRAQAAALAQALETPQERLREQIHALEERTREAEEKSHQIGARVQELDGWRGKVSRGGKERHKRAQPAKEKRNNDLYAAFQRHPLAKKNSARAIADVQEEVGTSLHPDTVAKIIRRVGRTSTS